MPKNILQDVVPKNGERSIRQIPIPDRPKRVHPPKFERRHSFEERKEVTESSSPAKPIREIRERPSTLQHETPREKEPPEKPPFPGEELETSIDTPETAVSGRSKKKIALIIAGIILIFAGGIAIITGFSGATVTVKPKVFTATINTTITAEPKSTDGDLTYEVVTLEKEKSETIPATGEKHVEEKASGTVVIFNNSSTASQRLIINTRLETPEGLIYRITQSIVVPGQTTKNGKVVPGSIEAKVVADNVGPKYNIGLTDFTIPGFKGTPKFETFYARSKTPMTGGFVGTVKVVDESIVEAKRKELRSRLETELRAEIPGQVREDVLAYPSLARISFETIPDTSTEKNSAVIAEKGTLVLPVFDHGSLARTLANDIEGYDNGFVSIENSETLGFSYVKEGSALSEAIDITVTGPIKLVSVIDSVAITKAISGISKKSFNEAISSIPGIERAHATIRPVWKRNFPTDPGEIEVVSALD